MNILEADSINISFSNRRILSDIYLMCQTNEIVGLVGRNGSGKSTLMKILFGSLQAENQSIRINKTYYQIPFETRGNINYLPQDTFLPDSMTASQAKKIFGIETWFREVLDVEHMKFGKLSKGQRRFIETLIILYAPTKFSLLDEPFSYLSPVMIEQLTPHIHKQSKVKGIVLSDHSYRTVMDICNRFYYLYDGIITPVEDKKDFQSIGYLPD